VEPPVPAREAVLVTSGAASPGRWGDVFTARETR
jgi:hypothetical protein